MDMMYHDPSECSGCFACRDVCPQGAVAVATDRSGFLYPEIDTDKCISCGLCSRICGYQKGNSGNKPVKVFAAAAKNDKILMNAASGGIFSVMARHFVDSGGIVCGAAMTRKKTGFDVHHVFSDNERDLHKLASSKYVKSSTDGIFRKAEEILRSGKQLLFSGTPCQIAALKAYLRKDYENLFTVDLICHGVPSLRLFNDYIDLYEKKHSCTVTDFRFRDKSSGQGMYYRITEKRGETSFKKRKSGKLSSYFGLFLKGAIYRENCYSCPYASEKRISDITIGDYWGIYQEHGDEIRKAGLDNRKGISCVLINTDKGSRMWDIISSELRSFESELRKVSAHNEQLRKPSAKPAGRTKIMRAYISGGYKAVDEIYRKDIRFKKYLYMLEPYIPKILKRNMKKALSRILNRKRS